MNRYIQQCIQQTIKLNHCHNLFRYIYIDEHPLIFEEIRLPLRSVCPFLELLFLSVLKEGLKNCCSQYSEIVFVTSNSIKLHKVYIATMKNTLIMRFFVFFFNKLMYEQANFNKHFHSEVQQKFCYTPNILPHSQPTTTSTSVLIKRLHLSYSF